MSDIPELTDRDFARAIPARVRRRLVAGVFETGDDVVALRKFVGLSQAQFARAVGISVHTLRNWEQGRRMPEGPAIALLRGLYTWQISKNAAFVQKLAVLSGSDNTYTESVSQLKAGVIGNLSMVLGYTWKHNSDVEIDTSLVTPRPFEKTDTYTTVSLEYVF